MGQYTCDLCKLPRHADNDGYHHAERRDGVHAQCCDACDDGLRNRYYLNCKRAGHPAFVPGQCWGCGFEILLDEAASVQAGAGWELTWCRKCGKSYCD